MWKICNSGATFRATLTLTDNTYIKTLTNADSSNSNINLNGYKLYVNGVELIK